VKPGDHVEAEGHMQKDKTLLASEIEIQKAGTPDEEELTGQVDSVDPAGRKLVLLGITVQFDDKTRNTTPEVD
jgi:hypothetical protein